MFIVTGEQTVSLFCVVGPGVLIASSIYNNNRYRYGPQYASDGVRSRYDRDFFQSRRETNPWIQWHLYEEKVITGVKISTRRDCCGEQLRNVTIRAGNFSVDNDYKGLLPTVNKLCGVFEGPGNDSMIYTINCTSAIMAKYITLQIIGNYSSLQINELDVITEPHVMKGKICIPN